MRRTGPVTSLMTWGVLVLTPAALGAKGCVFGGVVGLGDDGDASGGAAVFTAAGGNAAAFTTGGSAAGGSRTSGGSSGVLSASGGLPAQTGGRAPGAGGSTGAPSGPRLVTPTCWVTADSNMFGIQGPWYTFSDQGNGGKTVIVSPPDGGCPYVAGQGMCLHATSPGGGADNWLTWGAGIALNLNQASPSSDAVPLSPAPRCLTVVLSAGSTAPSGFTAEPTPLTPAATIGKLAPSIPVWPGSNEVCFANVTRNPACNTSPDRCIDPALLANGVTNITVVAHIGSNSGSLDFCIESLTPHD